MAIVAMMSFPYEEEEVHQTQSGQGPVQRVSRQSDQSDAKVVEEGC